MQFIKANLLVIPDVTLAEWVPLPTAGILWIISWVLRSIPNPRDFLIQLAVNRHTNDHNFPIAALVELVAIRNHLLHLD